MISGLVQILFFQSLGELISKFVLSAKGGHGVVREFLGLLEAKG